jgi:hypothetical protein
MIFKSNRFLATAQFKFPVFKVTNAATGQILTAGDPDQPISLEATFSDTRDEQKWYNQLRLYSVFQGFSKAKSANGGLILSLSQFLIPPQLPQKIKLTSKVVKVDSKIIISLPRI